MVKTTKFYYSIILLLMIYFLTKVFWDHITFDVTNYLSFIFIILGVILWSSRINVSSSKIFILFALFSLYIIFNGLLLTDNIRLVRGLYEYVYYALIFFAMVGYMRRVTKDDMHKVFKVLAILGVVLAVLTAVEYVREATIIDIGRFSGSYLSGRGIVFRPRVFSRSFLSHGVVMAILGFANLYMYRHEKKKKWLVFYGICVIAVLLTLSRGPLAAMGIATVIYLMDIKKLKTIKKSKIFISAALFTIGVILFYIVFLSNFTPANPQISMLLTRVRDTFDWTGDAGNVGRLRIWTFYWDHFINHNIWIGSGTSITGSSGVNLMMVTESGILKRLVELGVIGSALNYGLIILIIKYSLKKRKECHGDAITENMFKLSIAIISLILINDITLQSTEEIMVSFNLWFFLALLFVIPNYYMEKPVKLVNGTEGEKDGENLPTESQR